MGEFRPDPKLPPKEKNLFPKKQFKKKEPTGELPFFRRIVTKRGSKSEISGDDIPDITVSSMMHVLAKGQNQYPRFKLYEKNILIVTREEHREWDQGSREALRTMPEWNFVFALEEDLKEEYENLPQE